MPTAPRLVERGAWDRDPWGGLDEDEVETRSGADLASGWAGAVWCRGRQRSLAQGSYRAEFLGSARLDLTWTLAPPWLQAKRRGRRNGGFWMVLLG